MGYFSQFTKGLYYLLRSFRMINKKKILIVLGFLVVFILLFAFNNKVFAAELEPTILSGISFSNGVISTGSSNVAYFHTQDDIMYTITMNFSSSHPLYLTKGKPEIGSSYTEVTRLSPGETYTFMGNSDYYLTSFTGDLGDRFIVSYNYISGGGKVSSDIAEELTLQNLWTDINPVVPLVAIGVLFGLGFYLFKRSSKGSSKHQAKM